MRAPIIARGTSTNSSMPMPRKTSTAGSCATAACAASCDMPAGSSADCAPANGAEHRDGDHDGHAEERDAAVLAEPALPRHGRREHRLGGAVRLLLAGADHELERARRGEDADDGEERGGERLLEGGVRAHHLLQRDGHVGHVRPDLVDERRERGRERAHDRRARRPRDHRTCV